MERGETKMNKEYKVDKKIQKLFKELRTCEMKVWALVHKKYPEIPETQNLRYSGWGNVVIEISEDKK